MKNQGIKLLFVFLFSLGLSSCSAIEGIFKAGMAWGIILVIGVIALVVYLVSRAGKDK